MAGNIYFVFILRSLHHICRIVQKVDLLPVYLFFVIQDLCVSVSNSWTIIVDSVFHYFSLGEGGLVLVIRVLYCIKNIYTNLTSDIFFCFRYVPT